MSINHRRKGAVLSDDLFMIEAAGYRTRGFPGLLTFDFWPLALTTVDKGKACAQDGR